MRIAVAFLSASFVISSGAACTGRSTDPDSVEISADAAAPYAKKLESAVPVTDAAAFPVEASVIGTDPATVLLEVPRVAAAFEPTGHFRVQIWASAANTHTLLDANGRGAVPVNEARFLWGAGRLYVFFYAGDLDLQGHTTKHDGPVWDDDSVAFTFGDPDGAKRIVQISISGVVADGICPADAAGLSDTRCDLRWESGVRARTDFDGTLNDIRDRDEEWAVEAAVPLASLGLGSSGAGTRIPFSIRRCEMAHDGPRSCGTWGERPRESGVLVLEGR